MRQAILKIRGAMRRHPTLTFLSVLVSVLVGWYGLSSMWDRGVFAFTRSQQLAVLVRRLPYLDGRTPHLLLLGRRADRSLIPLAEKLGDDAVPELAQALRHKPTDYNSAESALYLLAYVIRTKLSLQALAESCHDDFGASPSFARYLNRTTAKAIGTAAMGYRFPVGSAVMHLDSVKPKEMCARVHAWYAQYADRIVETDYGRGILMPDDTVRPLGEYGIVLHRPDRYSNRIIVQYYMGTEHRFCSYSEYSRPEYVTEMGRIMSLDNYHNRYGPIRAPGMEKAVKERFFRLYAQRLQDDPTFWPFYPVIHHDVVIGYFDADHRRHGLWREIIATPVVTGERWYYHDEEVSEAEYYAQGGEDLVAQRLERDPTTWPYRSSIHHGVLAGFYDRKNRRHGRWLDVDATPVVTGERWYFHGEEVPEAEYYTRGGYDMAISLPWVEPEPVTAPDTAGGTEASLATEEKPAAPAAVGPAAADGGSDPSAP